MPSYRPGGPEAVPTAGLGSANGRGLSQILTKIMSKLKSLSPHRDLLAIAKSVSAEEGVPFSLIRKVAALESGWVPDAVSPTGYRGLMQLGGAAMTDVSRSNPDGLKFGAGRLTEPFDPEQNLRCGARYLVIVAKYMRCSVDVEADWPSIYMAYNIGAGNARLVLAGHPERAAPAISGQAYGPPDRYFATLTKALELA